MQHSRLLCKITSSMNRKSDTLALFLVLCLILSVSPRISAGSDSASILPLLDKPSNRPYFQNLLSEISEAQRSIEILMATAEHYPDYPQGLQSRIYDELVAASKRGVKVLVILDSSNWSKDITETNKATTRYLRDRGISVRFDDPEITTHAKLIILDKEVVVLGSSNWNYPSYADTFQTNVILKSKQVGEYFSRFFQSLWEDKPFTKIQPPVLSNGPTLVPIISYSNSRTYYSVASRILHSADTSIDLVIFKMVYYGQFKDSKSNLLMQELVDAHSRGVKVRVILDINDWSDSINKTNRESTLWLLGEGLKTVRFDPLEHTTHSKLVIVDGETTLLGSTNWSYYSLTKNTEVDLLVKDSPKVAGAFTHYFSELWDNARVPSRKMLSGELW